MGRANLGAGAGAGLSKGMRERGVGANARGAGRWLRGSEAHELSSKRGKSGARGPAKRVHFQYPGAMYHGGSSAMGRQRSGWTKGQSRRWGNTGHSQPACWKNTCASSAKSSLTRPGRYRDTFPLLLRFLKRRAGRDGAAQLLEGCLSARGVAGTSRYNHRPMRGDEGRWACLLVATGSGAGCIGSG